MKRKSIIDRMQRENKTICEYCGAEKQGLSFFIGASTAPAWTMIEGTGKMCCPACHPRATKDGQAAINRHVESFSRHYRCTCCDGEAHNQCEDHDTGYGVCDACLAKYGRDEFCHIPSCKAHDEKAVA